MAEAWVKVIPEMSGMRSSISKEFGAVDSEAAAKGKSSGGGFSSAFKGAIAGVGKAVAATSAAAGAAVAAIGTQALSAYADYEQLVGGVDTLFGSASGQLQKYASEAYRTAGMSANQYMEQATSFAASLVSSCGGDTAKAAEYANTAMTDMSDNVNKMGSNMEDVQNAYQGFAKQNYTIKMRAPARMKSAA